MSDQATDKGTIQKIMEQVNNLLDELTWSEDAEMYLIDEMIGTLLTPSTTKH